jgi:hypothetical protein
LDGVVAIAQARVEFAFAQGQDVGAQFEALLIVFCEARVIALFEERASLAFFGGLRPEGFRDVGDRFRQAV